MRKLIAAMACALAAVTSASAATISVSAYTLGGTQIKISGPIVPGDEQRFKTVADTMPADGVVVVSLASPGGIVPTAIAIERMVRERGRRGTARSQRRIDHSRLARPPGRAVEGPEPFHGAEPARW
jgi:hypothetical protein